MPKLIASKLCPHCGEKLPDTRPRVCPECMGSLQQRYLKAGCLSSGPTVLVLAIGIWALLHALP